MCLKCLCEFWDFVSKFYTSTFFRNDAVFVAISRQPCSHKIHERKVQKFRQYSKTKRGSVVGSPCKCMVSWWSTRSCNGLCGKLQAMIRPTALFCPFHTRIRCLIWAPAKMWGMGDNWYIVPFSWKCGGNVLPVPHQSTPMKDFIARCAVHFADNDSWFAC